MAAFEDRLDFVRFGFVCRREETFDVTLKLRKEEQKEKKNRKDPSDNSLCFYHLENQTGFDGDLFEVCCDVREQTVMFASLTSSP